jgi:hypothetical protein
LNEILVHNNHNGENFSLGINQFTGVHHTDILTKLGKGTLKGTYKCPAEGDVYHSEFPVEEQNYDWRQNGASSYVHEQGS